MTQGESVIAAGLAAVEGPVIGPGDWILNVCSMSRPAEQWPTVGGDVVATRLTQPRESVRLVNTSSEGVAGIPAALAFGPDACLYVTDEGHRAILRIDSSRSVTRLVDSFMGEPLNGPNDLAFDGNGNLYFTDPWGSSNTCPIGAVYGYRWASGELSRIDQGMQFPNGIAVIGDILYVAETYTRRVFAYELVASARARSRRLFCTLPLIEDASFQGPDGMALDIEGNLFVAHYGSGGIYAYNDRGELLQRIPVSGSRPTNVCFGGTDHSRLYVTIDDAGTLVELEAPTQGVILPFCPSAADEHPFSASLVGLERIAWSSPA